MSDFINCLVHSSNKYYFGLCSSFAFASVIYEPRALRKKMAKLSKAETFEKNNQRNINYYRR